MRQQDPDLASVKAFCDQLRFDRADDLVEAIVAVADAHTALEASGGPLITRTRLSLRVVTMVTSCVTRGPIGAGSAGASKGVGMLD